MNVLLTGATGVFGSSLLQDLLLCKHSVICLKRSFSIIDKNVSKVFESVSWYNADEIILEKIFKENNIDVVIHTATNYGKNESDFFDAYDANLFLPIELLRLASKYKSKAFISTGTFFDKELAAMPLSTQNVYMDTYVKSKHIFEYIAKSGICTTDMSFINMRLEHVYGLDGRRKFVNYILESLKNNVESLNLSEGWQERDWIYIDDVVQAYLTVLNNLEALNKSQSYVFEVGTGETHTVREFVELCKKIIGSDTVLLFGTQQMNNNELRFSKANTESLQSLGWRPKFTIEEGIKKILSDMR